MKRAAAAIIIVCMLFTLATAGVSASDTQIGMNVSGFFSTKPDGAFINGYIFTCYGSSVVTYFATWSTDCLSQLDLLQSVHSKHPEYGVFGLLHVDATSTPEAALAVIAQRGYTFPVIICDSVWQEVVDKSPFIPQSFIVSNEGVITEAWQAAFDSTATILERLSVWYEKPTADGDVDMNGSVTAADALLALRMSMDILDYDYPNIAHGDINGNGMLDAADALAILRLVMFGTY